jgi:hypothetical protein
MVETSQALVAIFGRRCPRITREEIRHAFELRQAGQNVDVFVFVQPKARTDEHDRFFGAIRDDFGEEIVWSPYSDRVEFQGQLFGTLIPFLLKKHGLTSPPLLGEERG